jgi:transposase
MWMPILRQIDDRNRRPRAFGGVPQELLFDQMKAVITRDLRLQGGALVRNLEFLRFAHPWTATCSTRGS